MLIKLMIWLEVLYLRYVDIGWLQSLFRKNRILEMWLVGWCQITLHQTDRVESLNLRQVTLRREFPDIDSTEMPNKILYLLYLGERTGQFYLSRLDRRGAALPRTTQNFRPYIEFLSL